MRNLTLACAAAAAVLTPMAATAQTTQDDYRLRQAQDNFNRELANYRSTAAYRNGTRGGTRAQVARDRLDRALTDYRTELDRYQQVIRQSTQYGYGNNGSYNNGSYNNGTYANNGTYTDDTYYDPSRDYRDGNYQERVLSNDERVYRGTDGRYYCKRSDGTTGLIVGGLAGGVLGNVIDGGRSRVLGTILGGIGGALGGRAIERGVNDRNGQVTCR